MRVGLIYGLYDPFTEELRYVGQTWCSLGLAKAGTQLPKLKTGPKPRRIAHG